MDHLQFKKKTKRKI